MIERLNIIKERYDEVNKELLDPEVLKDIKKTKELSIEQADLQEIVDCYDKYQKVLNDIDAAKELSKDPEMQEFAKEELSTLEESQILNYLKATNYKLGLLINFGEKSLKYKRFVN